jgi:hypothetical protein
MIRSTLLAMTTCVLLVASADTRPQPPMLNGVGDIKVNKVPCAVPEFLVTLPPMIEKDFKACVNGRNRPSDKLAETVLKQEVDKRAELNSVQVAPEFFSRVYRIRYSIEKKGGSLICNESMTYCLKEIKPIIHKRGLK